MMRYVFRAAQVTRLCALGASVCGAAYVSADRERREAFVRAGRIAACGLPIVYAYKVTLERAERAAAAENGGTPPAVDTIELAAVRSSVHRRSAERLLELAAQNGGIFIKFAQALSTNNFSLPAEYIETLSRAQECNEPKPWAAVARVFQEDCGLLPQEVFASIEEQPIAAASLAQVHRAMTKDGQSVAVKVQYPRLRIEASADMAAIKFFATLLGILFPAFAYTWILPEFEASLRNELNFLQEARNGERVAAMFASDPRVHVPAILRHLSTERVLVMEWIDGVRVNDLPALASVGIADPRELARTVCRVFADQYMVHGFVQCDPHPGNFKVRRRPHADGSVDASSPWQLVLLDHGMYRRTTPAFRTAFAALYRGLLLGEEAASLAAIAALGMEPSNLEALSLILVYRPPSRTAAALGGQISAAEVARLRAAGAAVDAYAVNRFMQRLPRDMLFVLRSMNMIRSINKDLGGSTRERLVALGEGAVRGLALAGDAPRPAAGAAGAPAAALVTVADIASPAGVLDEADSDAANPPGALLVLLRWLRTALGRELPREQTTYLNLLTRGAVVNDPTASEVDAARMAALRGAGAWSYLAHYAPRALARAATVVLEMTYLKSTLAYWDLFWIWTVWWGGFVPYRDPKRPHVGQNAG